MTQVRTGTRRYDCTSTRYALTKQRTDVPAGWGHECVGSQGGRARARGTSARIAEWRTLKLLPPHRGTTSLRGGGQPGETPNHAQRPVRTVATCERALWSGPIPPPEDTRDEALRTLLDLLRHGENEPCRFAAAKLLLEYSQEAIRAREWKEALHANAFDKMSDEELQELARGEQVAKRSG
jgi:hypothetical protein